MRAKRQLPRLVGAAAIWIGLFLVCIEVVFRAFPPAGLTRVHLIRGGNPEVALIKPHPYLSYALTPGFDRPGLHHNAFGYRGPEINPEEKSADVLRILCVGGSSTYGVSASSDEATWPARLEAFLRQTFPSQRFEVINAGAPGYSTFENSIDLSIRGVSLRPDIVIVYQGFNDIRAATWPGVKPDNTHFRKSWNLEKPATTALLELSETFLLARWFLTDYRHEEIALSRYVVIPENGDELVGSGRHIDSVALASFVRNMRNMIAVARASGARVLVAVEAYGEATIAPEIADYVDEGMTGLALALKQLVVEYSDPEVQLFDARATLPLGPNLFADGVHMTDEGSDRLGLLLKNRLGELGWIKPRQPSTASSLEETISTIGTARQQPPRSMP
ncbi:SGNH/GDSL hydrolase family protein [Mesorhizobium caraganae]|uniref:SGNH/GDSL hydrolase family protein n=1 Tax=Mesorhizobium caraganae TaxID=483206 RepID=UPI003ECEECA0